MNFERSNKRFFIFSLAFSNYFFFRISSSKEPNNNWNRWYIDEQIQNWDERRVWNDRRALDKVERRWNLYFYVASLHIRS